MQISDLKHLPVTNLIDLANESKVDNAGRMRKQDLIFAILKNKAKSLEDIYINSKFIYDYRNQINDNENIINSNTKLYIKDFYEEIKNLKNEDENKLIEINEKIIKKNNIKFKDFGQPLRLILTNSSQAPSIKDIVKILGISETVSRLQRHLKIRQ